MTKIFLVTCALPYANGPIHVGHLLEHIQADIWVRYQRMIGHQVFFICADDAHGTAIMLKAQQQGIEPEQMINSIGIEHQKDLAGFNISYDNYYSTHTKENYQFSILIYNILEKKGFIKKKVINQLYDPKKRMFLPDRFVTGNCPRCYSPDQYGDNCEICGSIYSPINLINAKSVLTGVTPIWRNSEQLFFELPLFTNMLKEWISSGSLPEPVANKLQEWFKIGLQPWNISRDAPYFGFNIPGTKNKYFYVWLDAPIGYISSFKNLCNKRSDICFEDFWNNDSKVELCHFIGKDIIYFHSLFWPAILEASGFRKPNHLFIHGYLKVNGKKMSKSRGNFIKASTWLKYLDADSLRYYYASKLSSNIEDIDLNLQDFAQRVNADIINKVVNLASRTASFINKIFGGCLAFRLKDPNLYEFFIKSADKIGDTFSKRDFKIAISNIMALADIANRYINEQKPWIVAKNPEHYTELQEICTMGINLFRVLMIYLKPVVPTLSERAENFLNHKLEWNSKAKPLLGHHITSFKKLYHSRIQSDSINSLLKYIKI